MISTPSLSPGTRAFVEDELQGWEGERMPMSRSWVEDALGDFPDGDRDVARLALLVYNAPYQVGDEVVLPVLDSKGEENLLKVLTWSGMTARRHVTERAAECYA